MGAGALHGAVDDEPRIVEVARPEISLREPEQVQRQAVLVAKIFAQFDGFYKGLHRLIVAVVDAVDVADFADSVDVDVDIAADLRELDGVLQVFERFVERLHVGAESPTR